MGYRISEAFKFRIFTFQFFDEHFSVSQVLFQRCIQARIFDC
jgi:hypothetical protein